MDNDIRNLQKWLNEGQETPIDRQALARVLAMAEQPAPVQQCMEHGECFGGECIYPATQPAHQEPVAWIDMGKWPPIRWRDGMLRKDVDQFHGQGLYTSPPASKPLTDDEIQECWYKTQGDAELFARAIEAAHGIKGGRMKEKKKQGRPPIDPAKKRHMVSISLTIAQREKMRKLGGSWWVQTQIDKAKLP